MKKYLRVKMSDRSEWDIPIEIIAEDIAKYYSTNEDEYQTEFDDAMKDSSMLIEWADNNLNWSDVESHAKIHKHASVDYGEEWNDAEKICHQQTRIMKKRFAIHPRHVRSKNDKDLHFISFSKLCQLYRVYPKECVDMSKEHLSRGFEDSHPENPKNLIQLFPKYNGNYKI